MANRFVTFLVFLALGAAIFVLWPAGRPAVQLSLVSGSENRPLEPIIQDWARRNDTEVTVTYMGSVDISRELAQGTETRFDAVWPANSIWVELGDSQNVASDCASILRSPVVLGLRQSIAADLGWTTRDDVTIQEISAAAETGRFRLAMTSATQSNSGASAFIGFLYALADNPDVLTMSHLEDPEVQDGVRSLLAQVDRSSGSSGWLGDALVANPDAYDAMFNYEAVVLEANVALTATGEEPLHLIYPANGISVADSPLCRIARGDDAQDEAFAALQAHLLSPEVQAQLLEQGRRAGLLGAVAPEDAGAIWNPAWGVDPARQVSPVPTPAAEVIEEALRLYQSELRKPSLTIWVLDVSGSMAGSPLEQLQEAMGLLLDPEAARLNLLQPSARDITIILPFSSQPYPAITVTGDDPDDLRMALRQVDQLQAGGGTDLYSALASAFQMLDPYDRQGTLDDYLPAIVAMTDGASDTANRAAFLRFTQSLRYGRDVPVHAIAFGAADENQLEELSDATIGRLFRANDDLAGALRSAKGYN